MPIKLTNIENLQQIEAVVSGPDNANRLFVVTGIAPANLSVSNATRTETFTFLIGPTLTRRQFIRAIATASLNRIGLSTSGGGPGVVINSNWSINFVDADWDDESGQVEVRVEVSVTSAPVTSAIVAGIGFQATILAEM